ncbi:MAG: glutathione S-transferase family protein [Parvularculaceae bacterium]|nr:MAG: glutathione S-transferase family protein [Parvularculaceae bacterium]
MKLYHCHNSRSLRPRWALEEMGLDYELETLPFPPRVFAKHYKEVNPLGTVPTLVDGDTVITESAGACDYLGVKYGPTPLAVRPDEPDYGAYLNWLHRSDATLTFPLTITFRYTALEPEERRLPQAAEDYRKWFLGRWRCVDDALADREYLCADRFTMADIAVGFSFLFSQILKVEEAATPNVNAWWERISSRPAYQRAAAE